MLKARAHVLCFPYQVSARVHFFHFSLSLGCSLHRFLRKQKWWIQFGQVRWRLFRGSSILITFEALLFETIARRACLLEHGGCLFDVRSCVLTSRSLYLYTVYRLWSFDLRIPLINNLYYSFKIFPQFWLAKNTCLIHHSQFLMTKFGGILTLTRKWRQKYSVFAG